MTKKPTLGKLLQEQHGLSDDDLAHALTQQQETGGKLGEILGAQGKVTPLELHKSLAKQTRRPFVNLMQHSPDPVLLSKAHVQDYISHEAMPWREVDDVLVIACSNITKDVTKWAEATYSDTQLQYVITSPRDIAWMIEKHFAKHIDHTTREQLALKAPELSARHTMLPGQKRSFTLFAAVLAVSAIWYPETSWIFFLIMVNLFYCLTMLFKFGLLLSVDRRDLTHRDPGYWRELTPDKDLPIYSILIPLYQEERSVPYILSAIRELDYPKHKLDVKLVVEARDEGTIKAIKRENPESFFEIIRVPESYPQTKPKACNYALSFVKGEFTTIYDAEDRPEPLQLRKAVHIFRHTPDDVACLQGRLNYYNRNENLMSQCFAIEYATLFDVLLPGLQRLGIPISLGGTSNHVKTSILRKVGEWDPYNVTEDADLGMRLSMHGYHTRMLPSVTLEESPLKFNAWLKQRARWIKGYMQTWLVYMRNPGALYKQTGLIGFTGFQFFIAGPCLVFLLSPTLWATCFLWIADVLPTALIPPDWLINAQWTILFAGLASNFCFALLSVKQWQWDNMTNAILVYPFYCLLHSIASFKATWQLIFRPHFWEKTTHGLTELSLRDMIAVVRNNAS